MDGRGDVEKGRAALGRARAAGLAVARYGYAYLVALTVASASAVGVLQNILLLEPADQWWACLAIKGTIVKKFVGVDTVSVLIAQLCLSTLVAWASLAVSQRALLRLEWVPSACLLLVSHVMLLTLPAADATWAAPALIPSSGVGLMIWALDGAKFDECAGPSAKRFVVLVVALIAAACLASATLLAALVRVLMARRAAGAAEEKSLRALFDAADDNGDGYISLSEAIRCVSRDDTLAGIFGLSGATRVRQESVARDQIVRRFRSFDANDDRRISWTEFWSVAAHEPRAERRSPLALGAAVIAVVLALAYAASSAARCVVSTTAQRAFDASVLRASGPSYVAPIAAPKTIAGTAAFLAAATLLSSNEADDVAGYRVSAALAFAALFLLLPAFAATARSARDHDLWFGSSCATDYLGGGPASKVYGFPSPGRAARICAAIRVDLNALSLFVACVGVLLVTSARALVAGSTDRFWRALVQPDPLVERCSYEFDLRGPSPRPDSPAILPTSPGGLSSFLQDSNSPSDGPTTPLLRDRSPAA
eukprot:CAMPEP_0119297402 /NCGR_PEP_ID=MMETSP1329-20130426/51056_1 /TAXON_ID=114041 /ORGANISM="Genus nov. species nov., Strain RCC1024" /LENGTH=537 /DNA_ID=CAMNT_0007298343 /DNA_START=134 /DNA_END=1743 /DNA_ORIENTATION=-